MKVKLHLGGGKKKKKRAAFLRSFAHSHSEKKALWSVCVCFVSCVERHMRKNRTT